MHRALLILLWVPGILLAQAAVPDGTAEYLPGCSLDPPPPLDPLPPGTPPDQVEVFAGGARLELGGPVDFSQRLTLRQGDRQLSADGATYDQGTGRFAIEGNVDYLDPETRVRGASAEYLADGEVLTVTGADFDLYTLPARGAAAELKVARAEVVTLQDVSYTSCARGKDDWLLRAGTLTVDRRSGTATARNARLEFMGVPVLWAPYLTYPVTNQRKSGLLLPDFGRSAQRGLDIEQPYYFNIAPQFDATFTPRYMSRRGIQAQGEFRYLARRHQGDFIAEYLPGDDVTGDNRALFAWEHVSLLPGGWRSTIDATDVSDTRYYEDLYSGLANTSQTHLDRRLDLEYYAGAWNVLVRLQDFQTLDEVNLTEADFPYRRLPQVVARGYWPRGPLGLEYTLDSEFTYFHRDVGVTGLRAWAQPELALPLEWRGVSFRPAMALDMAGYALDDVAEGEDDRVQRSIPYYSVDLGTVLERTTGRGGRWLQTVEPRLQFVHVPFEDQDGLPVFDTIDPDINIVQLFRRNRFVGLDRLGDTDQLSLGVTTRLLRARDGSQFLTATLGETLYFSSRDVQLDGKPASDDNSSDYIAELGMNFNDVWNVDLGYQWDSDESVTRLAEARVLYRPDDYRILNVSYRYRRDSLREIDLAAAWPLWDRWSIVGRFDYSLEEREPLERFLGLEYNTCCWGLRLVARRNLATREGESDTSVTLQLVLKGFGSQGSPAERLLDRGILGYDRFDRY